MFSRFVALILALAVLIWSSNGQECTKLKQSHFDKGTLRIRKSGTYCLAEDVEFNPLPGSMKNPNRYEKQSWFPKNAQKYPGSKMNAGGAYALGYFAAISIEASDVTLDLRGFTLSHHKHFYLQQRWGSIVEISNNAFLPGHGPADFGTEFANVQNVVIKNGNMGLSSHHSIHSNNASNVVIEDIHFFDFEVGAIHFNGFRDVTLRNLDIGPALQSVPLNGIVCFHIFDQMVETKVVSYYSNARFLLLGLRRILADFKEKNEDIPELSFSYMDKSECISLQQIYDDLIECMDIAFRDAIGQSTESDKANKMYKNALRLFKNTHLLPDGSAIYGIVLNSFGAAINGFGHSLNDGGRHGERVLIENVDIHDIKLRVMDVPALYFDECDGKESKMLQKGPYGDVMDIRKMIHPKLVRKINRYGRKRLNKDNLIKYLGNPLSDGQIAFFLFKDRLNDGFRAKTSFISEHFLNWALNDHGEGNEWPKCAKFVCNGDIMFHQNKGIVGLRMDGIEDAKIKNLVISNLENSSPLSPFTCAQFSGGHNGGHTATKRCRDREGAMDSDVRGLSVYDGDVSIKGINIIRGLESHFGDVVGIDLMDEAIVEFGGRRSAFSVTDLNAASKVTKATFQQLKRRKLTPFPNNFNLCTLEMEKKAKMKGAPSSLPRETDCKMPTFVNSAANAMTAVEDMDAMDILNEGMLEDDDLNSDGKVDGNGYLMDVFFLLSAGWLFFGALSLICACYYYGQRSKANMLSLKQTELIDVEMESDENQQMIE